MSADTRRELVYAIESPDRSRLYSQSEEQEGILNAAAEMRTDFPGEDFIITKRGEYDAHLTLIAQEGLMV